MREHSSAVAPLLDGPHVVKLRSSDKVTDSVYSVLRWYKSEKDTSASALKGQISLLDIEMIEKEFKGSVLTLCIHLKPTGLIVRKGASKGRVQERRVPMVLQCDTKERAQEWVAHLRGAFVAAKHIALLRTELAALKRSGQRGHIATLDPRNVALGEARPRKFAESISEAGFGLPDPSHNGSSVDFSAAGDSLSELGPLSSTTSAPPRSREPSMAESETGVGAGAGAGAGAEAEAEAEVRSSRRLYLSAALSSAPRCRCRRPPPRPRQFRSVTISSMISCPRCPTVARAARLRIRSIRLHTRGHSLMLWLTSASRTRRLGRRFRKLTP